MRSSLWRSPARWLAPVLVVVVETAVAAPLLALVDAFMDQDDLVRSPNPLALGLIGLIAFVLTRLLQARNLDLRAMQVLLVTGAAIAAVVAPPLQRLGTLWNPAEIGVTIVTAIAAVLAWWRGMRYGSDPEPFSADRLNSLVKLGWILLALQILLVAAIGGFDTDAAGRALRIAIPIAAAAGMVLLALGQIEQARINAARRGGRAPERRGWLLYAGLFAVAMLVIAALGSAVLGGEAAEWVLRPVGWLFRAATFVLTYALLAIALLFFGLFYPLFWLLEKLRSEDVDDQPDAQGGAGQLEEFVRDGGSGLPEAVQTAIEIGAVVAIVAVAALLIALSLRKVRRPDDFEAGDEERESLWSRELAASQLRGLFRRGADEEGPERIDPRRTPQSVREAYRAMQALAARDDVPRRDSETPAEFARRLSVAWPGQASEIVDLTARYERVRYGGAPDEGERTAAQRAWAAIWSARRTSVEEARR